MRAAEAAKNTANLIEGNVKRVKEGSELVEKTDREFREVAAGVGKSGELVGEISAATQEQAQGIEQVNKAVMEMDKVVQQNSASAEETASATEELYAQAERMKEVVGELAILVGGAGNGSGTRMDSAADLRAANGAKRRTTGLMKTAAVKSIDARAGAKGNGTHRTTHDKLQVGNTGAEKMIPFDEENAGGF